jgi:hypothetical protein
MNRRQRLIPAAVLSALALAGCAAEAEDPAIPKGTDPGTSETLPAKAAEVQHKTVRVKKTIPFSQRIVRTSTLDKGVTMVDQKGQLGVQVRVLRLTLEDGVEVGRDLVNTVVKRQAVAQVKLVGTREKPKPKPQPASNCDSNYSGGCVPVATDVDCAGGSGDGPGYVQGPVTVVGEDVYDLNRDDDNIACD